MDQTWESDIMVKWIISENKSKHVQNSRNQILCLKPWRECLPDSLPKRSRTPCPPRLPADYINTTPSPLTQARPPPPFPPWRILYARSSPPSHTHAPLKCTRLYALRARKGGPATSAHCVLIGIEEFSPSICTVCTMCIHICLDSIIIFHLKRLRNSTISLAIR
jgi:hypothetical protein